MDRIRAMHVFARVVEANSFSKAARTLSLSPASVTMIIQDLEIALGVTLLRRTTRSLSVTSDGATYYKLCRRILADLEETETHFRDAAGVPKGTLRVELPSSIARSVVLPALHGFQKRFPEVRLMISLAEQDHNLMRDGIDCAIRLGPLQSSRLVGRRIATLRPIICAAPSYLAQHGAPGTLEDLSRHRTVGLSCSRTGRPRDWAFIAEGKLVHLKLDSQVIVEGSEGNVMCGVRGLGLIRSLDRLVQPYLNTGRLREVLTDFKAPHEPVSIVYASDRLVPSTTRVFIDWAVKLFARTALRQLRKTAG